MVSALACPLPLMETLLLNPVSRFMETRASLHMAIASRIIVVERVRPLPSELASEVRAYFFRASSVDDMSSSNDLHVLQCRYCTATFHGAWASRNRNRHEQHKHAGMSSPGSTGSNKVCRNCKKSFQRGGECSFWCQVYFEVDHFLLDACLKHERTHEELRVAPAIPRKRSNELQTIGVS